MLLLSNCLSAIILLFCSIQICASKEVGESNTGALLRFPYAGDGVFLYNQTWEVAPAQFGYQKYGGKLTAWLVLPMNTTYHTECDGGEPKYTGEGENKEIANPYIHYMNDFFLEEEWTDFIFVIDRLDCYFVEKVEAAEALGAVGVIVCDKKNEHLFTMWMPSDWDDDISIPSVLLQESHCEVLMAHLGVRNWDPYTPESIVYPSAYNINWTIAEIEWGLPHDDDRVEWELWTSSNDESGTEFKHHFENISKELDAENYTVFTPHMYTLDGSHWNCNNVLLPCKKQCTNSGRYCSVDPEYDLTIGLDGLDVIRENLRSLCVWKFDKEHYAENNDIVWWDYVVAWDENCGILSPDGVTNFTADCAWRQMDKFNANLTDYVQDCIDDSGGYGYHDGKNTILEREMNLKKNNSVYAMPMVRVNEFMIHGNIDCPMPITVQSCEVLAAICAGFMNGTRPDVCELTPSPTPCPVTEEDCAGICFGSHQTDACNKCLLLNDPKWDECIGCDGIINATYDCNSVCDGNYKENACGYCINSSRSDFDSYMKDCAGGCSDTLQWDKCNQCREISSSAFDSCLGCDSVPFSGKEFNECGLCLLADTVTFDDEGKDCNGTCFGSMEIDECGVCLAPTDAEYNACIGCNGRNNETYDCEGVCGGNFMSNPCGYCISSNRTDFDDYMKDCNGTCSLTLAVDRCKTCLDTSSSKWDSCVGCDNVPYSDKEFNACGLCLTVDQDNFETEGKDCNGTCFGSSSYDSCGQCLLTTSSEWNSCMGCNQNNSEVFDCEGVCGGDYALNPCAYCIDSTRVDFDDYMVDCNGGCSITLSLDRCGQCLETSSNDRDACVGCDDIVNSTKILNPCGLCLLEDTANFDDEGVDCAGDCFGQHYIDDCNNCLYYEDEEWNACMDDGNMGTTKAGDTGGKDNNSDSNNKLWSQFTIIIVVIVICACLVILCAALIISKMWKKQKRMNKDLRQIRETYIPMDDGAGKKKKLFSSKKKRNKGMTSVPDNESDDEDFTVQ